jgi:hypothetical protein
MKTRSKVVNDLVLNDINPSSTTTILPLANMINKPLSTVRVLSKLKSIVKRIDILINNRKSYNEKSTKTSSVLQVFVDEY